METTEKPLRGKDGKLVKGAVINPSGKGGFADHPELRTDGRWKKENSISYQYNNILRMTEKEFATYKKATGKTMAQKIAIARFNDAEKSLNDTKEITDRTEGKAPQFIGLGDTEDYTKALVQFLDADSQDTATNRI